MATERERWAGLDSAKLAGARLVVPVVVVVLWAILGRVIGETLLPGPLVTLRNIQRGLQAGWIVDNTVPTLQVVLVAFALASVTGLAVGTVLGRRDHLYNLLEPYILSFYSIPKIALFPIFLLLFQVGTQTKLAFGTFQGFFPMLIMTMGAVRGIDHVFVDVSRSLRLSRYQFFRHILLPSILVQLVVALRLTFNLSFLGVILAELFASREGLGLILQHAIGTFDSQRIMVAIVVLTVVAILGNVVFFAAQTVLERRWNMTAEDVENI